MTVRVIVADDQPPFRGAARAVVAATPEFELVGEASSGEEAIALVDMLQPDVVLVDITMPGLGGIEATRSIAGAHPQTMTILVSTYREEDLPAQAHDCGAAAYLHKSNLDGRALRRLWSGRQTSSAR